MATPPTTSTITTTTTSTANSARSYTTPTTTTTTTTTVVSEALSRFQSLAPAPARPKAPAPSINPRTEALLVAARQEDLAAEFLEGSVLLDAGHNAQFRKRFVATFAQDSSQTCYGMQYQELYVAHKRHLEKLYGTDPKIYQLSEPYFENYLTQIQLVVQLLDTGRGDSLALHSLLFDLVSEHIGQMTKKVQRDKNLNPEAALKEMGVAQNEYILKTIQTVKDYCNPNAAFSSKLTGHLKQALATQLDYQLYTDQPLRQSLQLSGPALKEYLNGLIFLNKCRLDTSETGQMLFVTALALFVRQHRDADVSGLTQELALMSSNTMSQVEEQQVKGLIAQILKAQQQEDGSSNPYTLYVQQLRNVRDSLADEHDLSAYALAFVQGRMAGIIADASRDPNLDIRKRCRDEVLCAVRAVSHIDPMTPEEQDKLEAALEQRLISQVLNSEIVISCTDKDRLFRRLIGNLYLDRLVFAKALLGFVRQDVSDIYDNRQAEDDTSIKAEVLTKAEAITKALDNLFQMPVERQRSLQHDIFQALYNGVRQKQCEAIIERIFSDVPPSEDPGVHKRRQKEQEALQEQVRKRLQQSRYTIFRDGMPDESLRHDLSALFTKTLMARLAERYLQGELTTEKTNQWLMTMTSVITPEDELKIYGKISQLYKDQIVILDVTKQFRKGILTVESMEESIEASPFPLSTSVQDEVRHSVSHLFTGEVIGKITAQFQELEGDERQKQIQALRDHPAREISLEADRTKIYEHTSTLFADMIIKQFDALVADRAQRPGADLSAKYSSTGPLLSAFQTLIREHVWALTTKDGLRIQAHVSPLMSQLVMKQVEALFVAQAKTSYEGMISESGATPPAIMAYEALIKEHSWALTDTSKKNIQTHFAQLCQPKLVAQCLALFDTQRLIKPGDPDRKDNSLVLTAVLQPYERYLSPDEYDAVLEAVAIRTTSTWAGLKSVGWGTGKARQERMSAYAQQLLQERRLKRALDNRTLTEEMVDEVFGKIIDVNKRREMLANVFPVDDDTTWRERLVAEGQMATYAAVEVALGWWE